MSSDIQVFLDDLASVHVIRVLRNKESLGVLFLLLTRSIVHFLFAWCAIIIECELSVQEIFSNHLLHYIYDLCFCNSFMV